MQIFLTYHHTNTIFVIHTNMRQRFCPYNHTLLLNDQPFRIHHLKCIGFLKVLQARIPNGI